MIGAAESWLGLSPPPVEPPEGWREIVRPSARWIRVVRGFWGLERLFELGGILLSLAILRGLDIPFLPFLDDLDRWFRKFLPEFQIGSLTVTEDMILYTIEGFAITLFLIQVVVSWTKLHLEWGQRWALVGDGALRIHDGFWTEREQTLSLANVQNISLRQGPIQRLVGIADLEIRTAGGGSGGENGGEDSLHTARLKALDDADGVRNRLRRAVERHRGAGLGAKEPTGRSRRRPAPPSGEWEAVTAAARALRSEAGRLGETGRRLATRASGPGSGPAASS